MFLRRCTSFLHKNVGRIKINAQKRTYNTNPECPGKYGIFGKYLLLTNTLSGGAMMFVGDLIEQEIEFRRHIISKRYDKQRLLNMTLVGIALGPLHHYFYLYLHKILPKQNLHCVIRKILADQFVMSPLCILGFFYTICFLERKPVNDCTNELKEKFVEIYAVDWLVWPPTQFINFYYMPIKYQVLYVNAVTMLYNAFLSYVKYKKSLNNV